MLYKYLLSNNKIIVENSINNINLIYNNYYHLV